MALLSLFFHKQLCGPPANSRFTTNRRRGRNQIALRTGIGLGIIQSGWIALSFLFHDYVKIVARCNGLRASSTKS